MKIAACIFASLVALVSFAATADLAQKKSRDRDKSGAPIYLGPIDFVPGFKVDTGYNDSLFMSDGLKKGTWFTMLKPGFLLAFDRRRTSAKFTYGLQQSLYADSPTDDYLDQTWGGSLHHEFTGRSKVDLLWTAMRAHDLRGAGFGQGFTALTNLNTILPEPNQYTSDKYGLAYQYGSDKAKGRILANFAYTDKIYTNNIQNTLLGNTETYQYGLTFLYRLQPKTSLYLEADYSPIKYLKSIPNGFVYDNSGYFGYVGLTWKGTAKTTGNVKIGYVYKTFVDERIPTFTALTWQAGVTWQPLKYSSFDLIAKRDALPTLSADTSFIDQKTYSIEWKHAWTERINSDVSIGMTMYDWTNLSSQSQARSDKLYSTKFSVEYQARRWLTFGAAYTYGMRDSTITQYNYGQNVFMLTLGATL